MIPKGFLRFSLLLGALCPITLSPHSAWADEPLISYTPPDRSAPKENRVGGGTRGGVTHSSIDFLAPVDHAGLTSTPEPTVYVHLTEAKQVRFAVHELRPDKNRAVNKLLSLNDSPLLNLPPGVHAFNFSELGYALRPKTRYRLLLEPKDGSPTAAAFIVWPANTHVADSASFHKDALSRIQHFAAQGHWYDAVHECERALVTTKHTVVEHCAALLESMELDVSR